MFDGVDFMAISLKDDMQHFKGGSRFEEERAANKFKKESNNETSNYCIGWGISMRVLSITGAFLDSKVLIKTWK